MEKLWALIFFIVLSGLLISARFGFIFAGGEGYIKSLPVTIEVVEGKTQVDRAGKIRTVETSDSVTRGEKIMVGENSRAFIRIGENITVALDQQTDIVLEQLFPTQVEIKIVRGRLLASTSMETEKLIVTSPKATGEIAAGSMTVVRYDFLDKTTYATIGSPVFIDVLGGQTFQLNNSQALDINELNPAQPVLSEFNPQASSAAGFYEWAEDKLSEP
ncbi:MAG: hypothetical protein V1716_03855 [Candidatus Uhrbacteria bacterium]